jgi:hypothetical protein
LLAKHVPSGHTYNILFLRQALLTLGLEGYIKKIKRIYNPSCWLLMLGLTQSYYENNLVLGSGAVTQIKLYDNFCGYS